MKKYHVYGIGNALVDYEIEVSAADLQKMGVQKGLMTLVDQDTLDGLLAHVSGVHHKRECGGSAANSMITVSAFGGKSFYSCKVASDEVGEFYKKNLMDSGIDTNLNHRSNHQGKTGKCVVLITPDADRTMNTFLGITETFSEIELDEPALINSEYLYIEGYLVTSPTARKAVAKSKSIAQKNGVKTSLTFSDPGIVAGFKSGFKEFIGDGVDLLFCNEKEAFTYCETQNMDEVKQCLQKIARQFVVTLGEKGSFIFDGRNSIKIPPFPIQAIDSNGAGDTYAGAMLYGLTHGLSFEMAGTIASRASSRVVAQFGPRINKAIAEEILKSLRP